VIDRILKRYLDSQQSRVRNFQDLLKGKPAIYDAEKYRHKVPQIQLHIEFIKGLLTQTHDLEGMRRRVSAKLEDLDKQIQAHKSMLSQLSGVTKESLQYTSLIDEFENEKGFLEEVLEELPKPATAG
jgi:hypothetical protein